MDAAGSLPGNPKESETCSSVPVSTTTKGRAYPTRVECTFRGKRGRVVLDQIRAMDRVRLVRRLGNLSAVTSSEVLSVLGETFSE